MSTKPGAIHGTINRNTDHRDARDRFAMPDRMHVDSVVEGSTVARFSDSRVRQGAAPNENDTNFCETTCHS